jgi:hypothetical protein
MTAESMLDHAARQKFRGYVQRVAFSLTLSQPMISALCAVRDYPPYDNRADHDALKHNQLVTTVRGANGGCLFITEISALERRGLAYHNPSPKDDPWPQGHLFYRLTRAGELTCDLLVEAGLMPPRAIIGFGT